MSKQLIVLVGTCLVLSMQGCATLKGAKDGACEGFKKDWQSTKGLDAWIEENLW